MPNITITDNARSGALKSNQGQWGTIWPQANAAAKNQGETKLCTHAWFGMPPQVVFYRGAFSFDLSDLPVNAKIKLAKLQLYVVSKSFAEMGPGMYSDVYMIQGDPGKPAANPVVADFNRNNWHGNVVLGMKNEGDIGIGSYQDFDFSVLSTIIPGTDFTFYFLEAFDRSNSPIGVPEYMTVHMPGAANPPKLYLEYTIPGRRCIGVF